MIRVKSREISAFFMLEIAFFGWKSGILYREMALHVGTTAEKASAVA
jgi:hypothetical protein